MATFGYAGTILRIDLSSGSRTAISTSDYADRFVGGKGIAAKIYWDEVGPTVGAFDEENALIFATGPLAGVPALGSSRWEVCGKSAILTPHRFSYCNLGGNWGAVLKFAGYDAIVVRAKSEKPVYLFLHDGALEVKDASHLWGKGAIQTREVLKNELGGSAKVVAIGPAGENMAVDANLVADSDASGSGGLGAAMGSKKLKAIVVKGTRKRAEVAQPERLRELIRYFLELRSSKIYPDELPGGAPITGKGDRWKSAPCFGCLGCFRKTYRAENGQEGKYMCHGSAFYALRAQAYYKEQTEVPFYANKLCDDYGLSTMAIHSIMNWLERCQKAGILSDENTGIPISKSGSLEYVETLVRKISLREGFGDILANGLFKAAEWVGPQGREQLGDLVSKTGDSISMDTPRLYPTTMMIHAMEPRWPIGPIHHLVWPFMWWRDSVMQTPEAARTTSEEVSFDDLRTIARRFWGSEVAADLSTYEGKALAAKMIQDREHAKECLILCNLLWPIMYARDSEGLMGEPTLESRVLSAVTGNEVDEEGLSRIGERVFNLQRAILTREVHGGRDLDTLPESWHTMPLKFDWKNPKCQVPGKDGKVICRKGEVVDREQFERVKDEYYCLRGWDVATGLQTRAKLESLGLPDVARDLTATGLAV